VRTYTYDYAKLGVDQASCATAKIGDECNYPTAIADAYRTLQIMYYVTI